MRIGIHVGEVIVEPERLTGDAVNIAARVESFAVPGAVMLSDAAYDQVRNQIDLGVVALGPSSSRTSAGRSSSTRLRAMASSCPDRTALEGKGETVREPAGNLPEPRRLSSAGPELAASSSSS